MKQQKSTTFLVIMLLISSLVFLYPLISDYWNSFHQSGVISNYEDSIHELKGKNYDDILSKAQSYNEKLVAHQHVKFENGAPVDDYYASLLKVNDSDVMGYVNIDKIDVMLPIYHGTSESALAAGTGHLEGSSLPIGGNSTHAVITGHRGLASATLFTHLDEMKIGDIFTVNVLDQILYYQVDQVLIVSPDKVDDISIVEGKDYCTLVTCTPFGINTDRMLVRGARIDEIEKEILRLAPEAKLIDPMAVTVCILVPLVLIFMLAIFLTPAKIKKH